MNDQAELLYKEKYQSVRDACELLTPGCYQVKVDLKAAYRSIAINPDHHTLAGLKWTFENDVHPTYMVDTRLMFGARLSPSIFHRLSQCIRRMMQRRGYECVVYLDDFGLQPMINTHVLKQ